MPADNADLAGVPSARSDLIEALASLVDLVGVPSARSDLVKALASLDDLAEALASLDNLVKLPSAVFEGSAESYPTRPTQRPESTDTAQGSPTRPRFGVELATRPCQGRFGPDTADSAESSLTRSSRPIRLRVKAESASHLFACDGRL